MYLKVCEEIKKNLSALACVNKYPKIVIASKNRDVEQIKKLYDEGARDFGESKVQEFLEKKAVLPPDINWHFIGTLQKNKASKIVDKCELIHSVDSFELLDKLAAISVTNQKILLQVNTTGENTKHGFKVSEIMENWSRLKNISTLTISGLMTMGPKDLDPLKTKKAFETLNHLRKFLKNKSPSFSNLNELSMGMSQDYLIAIQEEATIVRIGTLFFAC
jgi:pyridoxal phosphate enzyme (YggS family)